VVHLSTKKRMRKLRWFSYSFVDIKENIGGRETHKFYGFTNKIVLPNRVTFLAPLCSFFPDRRFSSWTGRSREIYFIFVL